MMKQQNCKTCKMILEEETVTFGGMLLRYQLFVTNGSNARFIIRVATGDEQTEALLGDRVDPALKLYRAIVRGRVTPCALQDVVGDFCF